MTNRSSIAVALASLLAVTPAVRSPRATVEAYISALGALDYESMNRYWSAEAVSVAADGSERPIDRGRMRDMRAFERVMGTRWTMSIESVVEDKVTVREVERNDLYEALGVGACIQTALYTVRDGLVAKMATKEVRYSGRTFREAFAEFERWCLANGAAGEPGFFEGDHMSFTQQSARIAKRWLDAWKRGKKR